MRPVAAWLGSDHAPRPDLGYARMTEISMVAMPPPLDRRERGLPLYLYLRERIVTAGDASAIGARVLRFDA